MAHLPLKRRAGAHQGSKTGHAGRLDLPSMHPLKKDKHVEKQVCRKLPQNLSFQDHVATLGDPSLDAGHQRKKLRRELASDLVHEGLCGPIMRTFTLQLDGEDWEWTYLCLVALLNKLCALQPRLGDLIQNTPSVACYMDEVKPGNVLRPDPARTVACFYWTLKNGDIVFRLGTAGIRRWTKPKEALKVKLLSPEAIIPRQVSTCTRLVLYIKDRSWAPGIQLTGSQSGH